MSTARLVQLIGKGLPILLLSAALIDPRAAHAQALSQVAPFLAGAATALGAHEAGHLVFNVAFDADPGVKAVRFGPLPFFAITHEPVSPAREFAISSAGFWVQHATNEVMLTRRPRLREERAPFAKGMFAFNVLTSIGYAGAAFAKAGPVERDTRGMAMTARLDEAWVGGAILAPAVLDVARYYRPESRWLKWASRATKIGGALLIVRAASDEDGP